MYDGFSVKTHRTVDYKQWPFGWAGSSLLCRLLSSYGEQGLLSGCEVWASHCGGFSHHRAQALGHGLQEVWHLGPVGSVVVVPGFWNTGLAVVAHGLSCSRACGIFLDQGSKSCLRHWQANSLPLSYQGSPACLVAQSCPNFCDSIAHQAPLSMGFYRQECLSGLPFPSAGDLPNPETEPVFLVFLLHCRWILYLLSHQGSPKEWHLLYLKWKKKKSGCREGRMKCKLWQINLTLLQIYDITSQKWMENK